MSHSTVLVVGPNPEKQLAPFSEELEVEPYKDYVDADPNTWPLSAVVKHGVDVNDHEAVVAWFKERWEEEYGFDEHGLYQVSTYNPNSKWDWYQLGGRWAGTFLLRSDRLIRGAAPIDFSWGWSEEEKAEKLASGNWTDQAYKGDVDWVGTVDAAEARARTEYEKYEGVVAGLEVPPTWKAMLEKHGTEHIDDARAEFDSYPWVRALRENQLDPFMSDSHEYWCVGEGVEAFVRKARRNAILTFAVLKDSEWYERGHMGWWGMVADEMSDEEWAERWHDLVMALPDDTLLSVYDVHI